MSAWEMFEIWPLKLRKFFDRWETIPKLLETDPEDAWDRQQASDALREIAEGWETLAGFSASARAARRLADRIERGDLENLSVRGDEVLRLYQDELEECLFFGLTREEAHLFKDPDLPSETADRFPSAAQEIGDASRCLALDMPTASAFHSIRALEVVLAVVASELKIERGQKGQNWQEAIDRIEKALRKRRDDKATWGEWLGKWNDFYTGLAIHYYHLKNAKRNPIMHWSTETVDNRRARQLREHTIQLIEAVSERLSEPPPTEPEPPSGRSPGDAQD